jgi:hypothetical protein
VRHRGTLAGRPGNRHHPPPGTPTGSPGDVHLAPPEVRYAAAVTLSPTAERALDAYGGAARWKSASTLRVVLSASGVAFRLKWQPALVRARQEHAVHEPRVRCAGIDRAGNIGILEGPDVRLEAPDGRPLGARLDARSFFGPGRRLLWWDALDQTYFACYAAWNYFTLPALLLREDIGWTEPAPGVLEARFPPHLPTHSPAQRFRFDPATGLLVQHDYTAEIIGGWAHAARVVLEHGRQGGVAFPRRMRITPRSGDGTPRRFPVLVAVEAHELELTSSGAAAPSTGRGAAPAPPPSAASRP